MTFRAMIEPLLVELSGQRRQRQAHPALPFPVITYADAVEKYGIDRPDLRFGQQLFNSTTW